MNGITINDNIVTIPYHFTLPLDPYYKFMKHATVLIFDNRENDNYRYRYDHPISLVPTIKILKIKRLPRYPIILTPSVCTLELLCGSNHSIILTPNITTLILKDFNTSITLTPNIITLNFGSIFNQPIVLTKNIVYLLFDGTFRHSLILNKKLNVLTLGYCNSNRMFTLSKYLISLEYRTEQSLILNKNMRKLTFYEYVDPLVLSKNMLIFIVKKEFNKKLVLNKCITHLSLCYLSFDKSIILTKNIVHFSISCKNISDYEVVRKTILIFGIKTFSFKNSNHYLNYIPPSNIVKMSKAFGDNLPDTITKIDSDTLEMFDNVPTNVKYFG